MRSELEGMTDEFLRCRDKHHRWEPLTVDETTKRDGHLRVVEKCEICTAERTSLLSLRAKSRGHILRSWMSYYPEGYLMPKGAGRMNVDDRGELRLYRWGYA